VTAGQAIDVPVLVLVEHVDALRAETIEHPGA